MVLTPEQAKERAEESHQRWIEGILKNLEAIIDNRLIGGKTSMIPLGLVGYSLSQEHPEILEMLKERYTSAGWKVDYKPYRSSMKGEENFYVTLN